MYSRTLLKYLIALILLISAIILITQNNIDNIKEDNYLKESVKLKEKLKTLIEEKNSATKIIAVSLSQNEQIKNSIIENKPDLVDLKDIYKQYNQKTKFKNVWLQIITKDGISFSRSWVNKRGDYLLNARKDLKQFLQNPISKSTISVGKFDLTFKSMVPIYKDKKFIGIFEVITHFNSISKILTNHAIESLFLADKTYKKQLIKPFTKMFVEDYYIANFDAPKKLQNYFKNNKQIIEDNKQYTVDSKTNRFITIHTLQDVDGKNMAYLILSKRLNSIKHDNTHALKIGQVFFIIFGVLIFFMIILYLKVKKNEKQLIEKNNLLQIQKEKTQKIFDAQPSITIITNGKSIYDANKEFFNFFDKYRNIEEFKKDYDCICDFFEKDDDASYIYGKTINGETWINYLLKNSDKNYKVKMQKNNKEHHFVIIANISNTIMDNEDKLIVVSLVDISHEVELQNDIREKDKILLQQSKIASMGEMIENIAHQWRQPLSVVSTVATGLKMKLEYDLFEKDEAVKDLDILNKNSQYLSTTIDDFRNFFKNKVDKNFFELNQFIKQNINLLSGALKLNNIELIFDTDNEKIDIESFENVFTQALLNIINNAKDALKDKDHETKVIIINTSMKDNTITISIKDNAGGIDKEIMDRIFEPYFTTKHQSQGTGIGLYMTDQIVTKHLNGSINVKNISFKYNENSFTGAEFIITLPVS